jgi:flagellar protein FliS
MYARAASAYRRVDLDSAPKPDIVVRLFARFAEDVEATRVALAGRDIAGKARALDHAGRIVVELRAALDHQAAPELAANLDSLYGFVQAQLNRVNAELDAGPLDAAARVMRELGEAFAGARHQATP